MSEESPQPEQQQHPPEQEQGKSSYQEDMSERKEQSNQRTLEKIAREREEMDKMQRFGFFSIPYPSTVGDQAYSRNREFEHHQVVDRKVITEKRGIYTQPVKKGKGPDVYFEPIAPLNNAQLEELKKKKEEEDAKYKEIVKQRKEKKAVIRFKPAGPQEVIGFYNSDEKSPVPDGPLIREKDRLRFIQDRKVITEKRGIFTNPTKLGTSLNPNDYFSYYTTDKIIQENIKKRAEEEKEKATKERQAKRVYKKPFSPASLMKCDCFASDSETYGLDPALEKERLNEFRELKKKGRPKYEKPKIPGSVSHDKPFSPPKLISTGRDCLFNDDLYKLPKLPQSTKNSMSLRERIEYEKAHRKNPFTYNKLMNTATFSPSISSFSCNLKREFPSICFH